MTETIVASSILIILVMIIRQIFGRYLSRRFIFGLWVVIAMRLLLLPFIPMPYNASMMDLLCQPIANFSDRVSIAFSHQENHVSLLKDSAEADNRQMADNGLSQSSDMAKITLSSILAMIWVVGILVKMLTILVPFIRIYHHIRVKRQFYEEIPGSRLRVFTVDGLETPCLIWNCIYVPKSLPAKAEQYRYVIQHELIHYRQLDPIWNIIRLVSICVYWFHPLVQVAAYLSKKDSEMACDERVTVNLSDKERKMYCQTILEIVTGYSFQHKEIVGCSTMAEGDVLKRIRVITNPPSLRKGLSAIVMIVVLVLTGATMNSNEADMVTASFIKSKDYSMYSLFKKAKITKMVYRDGILSTECSNASDYDSLILESELEYYHEKELRWMSAEKLVADENQMYVIKSEKLDSFFANLHDVQFMRQEILLAYCKNIKEDLAQIYGYLPKGRYRKSFLVADEKGSREMVSGYFGIK